MNGDEIVVHFHKGVGRRSELKLAFVRHGGGSLAVHMHRVTK